METLELNLQAKLSYEAFKKRERRNQMRQWRRQKTLLFNSKESFMEWLDFTKWHNRPYIVDDDGFLCNVTFLDWKLK